MTPAQAGSTRQKSLSFIGKHSHGFLRQEQTAPTIGHLKHLGRLGQGQEQICSVCSAALEAFEDPPDVVCSDSTCKVWGGWLSAVWAIGFSDWLCASCMTILIGGVLANQRGVWEERSTVCALDFYAHHSVISCFHVAPPAYCILRKLRTYTLAARWSSVFNATFLTNGSDKRQQSGRMKSVSCWFESGWCVGAFKQPVNIKFLLLTMV